MRTYEDCLLGTLEAGDISLRVVNDGPYGYLQQHNAQAAAAAAASAQAHFSRPSTVMPPITATSATTTPITALPTMQYQSASSAAATTAVHAALAHQTPAFSAYSQGEDWVGHQVDRRSKQV